MKILAIPVACGLALAAALLGTQAMGMAASTDAVTGLPLYPNAGTPDNTVTAPMCGSKATIDTYDLLPGSDAAAVAWFTAHLRGFAHTREMAVGHTQDMFIKRDGTVAADVTGNVNGSLYGVSYMRVRPALSPSDQAKLGKLMTGCG